MELNEALGLVIKAIRQQRALSQENLGASQSYISMIERGKWNPTIGKIEQVAEVLSVQPATLLVLAHLKQTSTSDVDAILKEVQTEVAGFMAG
ncbi:helix-turn-helix domain-containing protein [Pseudomonas anguilliseptica]|uniref:helix-turn-helix domain-containing protein n=1 Tax=Pseudomonas anguilliseptica TaxID=53406 RepID=UPI00325C0912